MKYAPMLALLYTMGKIIGAAALACLCAPAFADASAAFKTKLASAANLCLSAVDQQKDYVAEFAAREGFAWDSQLKVYRWEDAAAGQTLAVVAKKDGGDFLCDVRIAASTLGVQELRSLVSAWAVGRGYEVTPGPADLLQGEDEDTAFTFIPASGGYLLTFEPL